MKKKKDMNKGQIVKITNTIRCKVKNRFNMKLKNKNIVFIRWKEEKYRVKDNDEKLEKSK